MSTGTSIVLIVAALQAAETSPRGPERSRPTQLFFSSDGRHLTVVESGSRSLARYEVASGRRVERLPLAIPKARHSPGSPLFILDEARARVAFCVPGKAAITVRQGIPGSSRSTVSGERHFPTDANPQAAAFTADGQRLIVACDPPAGPERAVLIIDLKDASISRRPIAGSSNLRGVAVTPDGSFALATHLVPKSDLPATQIEQGWVFVNTLSFVPIRDGGPVVTLPLDLRTRGFANPEGVAITPDRRRAYVAHAGADLVSVVDLDAFVAVAREVASGTREQATATPQAPAASPLTTGYRSDDFRLTKRYVRTRIAVGSNPRGIAASPDGKLVAVANRLDDTISLIDVASERVVKLFACRDEAPSAATEAVESARLGEKLFHSGELAFGGQFSCASCHPDGHVDGLNWDLPADGFNNFHNTKSLLAINGTAPYGWPGNSPDLRSRFEGTLRYLFQHEPTEIESRAIEQYLLELGAIPAGPRAAEPGPAAARGRELFHGVARCAECHRGQRLTDQSRHDVGTGTGGDDLFDTPSLMGVADSAPYLHDGRARTLDEIFSRHNRAGLHGAAAELSPSQRADLIEYLKGL